ncbi:unnamed protein product [Symbiodinium natans]|uniref:Uncharacterized protein n=1 Tax=Symbiodinium natans TaxID=878477 RepID=A0A812QSU4_9DINO|nr:unnamed protein product [Symbiodinium natans]
MTGEESSSEELLPETHPDRLGQVQRMAGRTPSAPICTDASGRQVPGQGQSASEEQGVESDSELFGHDPFEAAAGVYETPGSDEPSTSVPAPPVSTSPGSPCTEEPSRPMASAPAPAPGSPCTEDPSRPMASAPAPAPGTPLTVPPPQHAGPAAPPPAKGSKSASSSSSSSSSSNSEPGSEEVTEFQQRLEGMVKHALAKYLPKAVAKAAVLAQRTVPSLHLKYNNFKLG